MEIWQTAVLTGVGVIVSGALGYAGAQVGKGLAVIKDTPETIKRILELNERQTKNIATLVKVQRPIIRSLRSHSYALRECGANGSVTKALEHINEAEDALNGRTDEAIVEGMRA